MNEIMKITSDLSSLLAYTKSDKCQSEENECEVATEEKWRSVARKVDYHCMILYITLMLLFHVIIAFIVAFGA